MVYQPEYGHLLSMNAVAAEDLPYYRFIEITEAGLVLAANKGNLVGVTVPSVQDYALNKDGTSRKRNGYFNGEKPQILITGSCYVEISTKVTRGDYIYIDRDGKSKFIPKESAKTEKVIGMALDTKEEAGFIRAKLNVIG